MSARHSIDTPPPRPAAGRPGPLRRPPGGRPRYPWLARLALAVCLTIISVLAFAPLTADPGTGHDKLNHLLAFGVLAWLADLAFPGPGPDPWSGWGLAKWVGLLGYGLFIETVQFFLPYRDFSLWDLAADAAGLLGYVLGARLAAAARAGRTRPSISSARPSRGG